MRVSVRDWQISEEDADSVVRCTADTLERENSLDAAAR
jgi:hypothetical protein